MADVLDFYTLVEQLADKRVVLQMSDEILTDRPDMATIVSMTARLKQSEATKNFEHWYMEDQIRPPYASINTNFTPPAQKTDDHTFVFPASDAPWFKPVGTIFFLGWGGHQQMRVTNVVVGANCTVTAKLWPSTQNATSAATAPAKVVLTYPVFGTLADAPLGSFKDVTAKYNYLEQYMRSVTTSRVLNATQLYGGDLRQREHKKALQAFLCDQETSLLWGVKNKDTSGINDPDVGVIFKCGGIIPEISSHVFDMGGATLTYSHILQKLPLIREYSQPQDLAIFAPTSFMSRLVEWGLDKVMKSEDSEKFGMKVTTLVTPFGDLPIIYSPLFDHYGANHILILNTATVTRMVLKGEDSMLGQPTLYLNQQLSDQPNKVLDFYRAIGGLRFSPEVKSGYFTNWA